MLVTQHERQIFTHIQKETSYISVYLNFYIFEVQTERQMILDRMLTGNS
jgi:hypothetical protein